jgi:hypothetical protein
MDLPQRGPTNQSVPPVSRLASDGAGTFGTLPRGLDLAGIVDRTTPNTD